MAIIDDLRREEQEMQTRLKAVQTEIIAEEGGLDMTVYRRRLEESGLLSKWDALQAKIQKLAPKPVKSENQQRKEDGRVYLKRLHPFEG